MNTHIYNNMRKTVSRAACCCLLLVSGLLVSCSDYLETKTFGKKLPKSNDDYEQLLANQLRNLENTNDPYFGSCQLVSQWESYSDNTNASLKSAAQATYLPDYVGANIGATQYRIQNLYGRIKDHNIILGNLPEPDTEKGRLLTATCHAMRGALYFYAMRECCEAYDPSRISEILGLPIVDEFNIEGQPARSSLQQTIDFIVGDLQQAIDMNVEDDKYVFNVDVARAFLARTYFWGQQWQQAIDQAKMLLEKFPLLSGDDYLNMLKDQTGKSGNTIFRTYRTGAATYYNNALTHSKKRPVDVKLVNLFAEKGRDIRYTFSFNKNLQNQKPLVLRIRSAEMCLIIAESYAHLGNNAEALKYLNMLREHRISNYEPLTEATLPAVDRSALIQQDATGQPLTPLMQAILNERRKELYMEGDRWFELKRNGGPEFWVGYNGVKYVTEHYLYTYPFSIRDIRINPAIRQNPGYPD